mmetsp:Transcript_10134/g.22811  ORF Transcript_10134/g.22811 Transcript_10134/m.22811 type:complete len:164 (+) Transcript_10134:194-685(+)
MRIALFWGHFLGWPTAVAACMSAGGGSYNVAANSSAGSGASGSSGAGGKGNTPVASGTTGGSLLDACDGMSNWQLVTSSRDFKSPTFLESSVSGTRDLGDPKLSASPVFKCAVPLRDGECLLLVAPLEGGLTPASRTGSGAAASGDIECATTFALALAASAAS